MVRVIPLLSRHDRPQDPRVLVGQGDHGLLPASTLSQLLSPQEDWVVVLACQRNGLSALNEQGSQVYASTLGDTAQTGLSATGVLLGCQTQPSSELSSVSELSEVTHRGHECRCSDRADAHQLGGTLDLFIVFLVIGNALIAPLDVRIQLAPVLLRSLQNKASNAGNVIAGIFNDVAQMAAQHFRALRQHDPELCQQAANAVDTGGPFFLESFPQPVHAEHALLRQCFWWHEVHVWPGSRLTDGSSIVRIVLAAAALHPIGRYRGPRNDPGVEPALNQLAAPVVSSAACLHRDQAACRQVSAPEQELLALHGAIGDHFARGIHRVDLNQILGQVDTNSGNLVHGGSPSAWGLRLTFHKANLGTVVPSLGSGKSLRIHIGVDADSGLVHTVTTTAANEADVEQVADLLHGKEDQVWADSGYRGAPARVDREDLQWHIAARPSDIAKLPEGKAKKKVQKAEHRKASMRAKVEHPFRVIKRQFGLVKVRFRGLAKNTAHVVTLFALSNLWMVRKQLMAMTGVVRLRTA